MSLMFFTITTIYSQSEKVKMLLGGQFNFSGSNNNFENGSTKSDGNSYSFTLAPNFGYFISDNFAIGTNLSLSTTNSWSESQSYSESRSESHLSSYGIGMFARRYLTVNEKFRFYLGGGISFSTFHLKSSEISYYNDYDYDRNQDGNSFGLGVVPGIVYFVTPRLGFEAQFGSFNYHRTSIDTEEIDDNGNKTNESSDDNGFNLNLNASSFYLGLNYYF